MCYDACHFTRNKWQQLDEFCSFEEILHLLLADIENLVYESRYTSSKEVTKISIV